MEGEHKTQTWAVCSLLLSHFTPAFLLPLWLLKVLSGSVSGSMLQAVAGVGGFDGICFVFQWLGGTITSLAAPRSLHQSHTRRGGYSWVIACHTPCAEEGPAERPWEPGSPRYAVSLMLSELQC